MNKIEFKYLKYKKLIHNETYKIFIKFGMEYEDLFSVASLEFVKVMKKEILNPKMNAKYMKIKIWGALMAYVGKNIKHTLHREPETESTHIGLQYEYALINDFLRMNLPFKQARVVFLIYSGFGEYELAKYYGCSCAAISSLKKNAIRNIQKKIRDEKTATN